jgi:multidrug efflux system outer membrane protein
MADSRTNRPLIAGGAAALLTMVTWGCTMGPTYHRPVVTVPDQYRERSVPTSPESLADRTWWDLFDDPALKQLIRAALENNYDLRAAAWRVEQARAQAGITKSQVYPQVDYGATVGRGAMPSSEAANEFQANVGVSWEIDLWGRIRKLNEAALAQFLATEEARRGVMLSLVSDVASSYFQLRELDDQLAIARRTTAAFQETANLFKRKLQAGAASALETARADAALNSIAANIPLIESQISALENQISLLIGRGPGPIPRGPALLTMTLPLQVPAGLPSALLQRRPDIREAEQAVVAANALVGAVAASRFPSLSLTGLLGVVSPELSSLFRDGRTWSSAGGVMGPVLNGGRVRHQKAQAVAQWEESQVEYERVVNSALAETASGLRAHQKLGEAQQLEAKAVAAYAEAVRLSRLRYASGLSAYFEVLDAMSQLYPAELSFSSLQRDRLVNFVNLYKALGGGWQSADQKPPTT